MAIVVEEEKTNGNLMTLIGWLGIVVIIIIAAYYIFFAAPELVIISPSGGLSEIAPIANLNLDPSQVTGGTLFRALQSPIPPLNPAIPAPGRPNPFLAP